uniref:Tripartite motif-containing protein 16-like n=1 Tax=Electrophorus electricus TaxID=8005 RepID=A0A4W4G4R3_ELEEL
MTEASISLDQDQFSCLVCLDLLKDPVTIPCGHSFCMVCINDCWDENDQRRIYSCPQCRETFTPRPVLHRNNMLAEVMEKLKKTELQAAGPEDVECDFCTGRKLKAIKSCLMCQASFCETHLKPHYEVPGLKKHKLIKASSHLQEKICSQHGKVIKIYCRTDQNCICYLCMLHEHKGHDTVPAGEEISKKQSELKEEQRQFEQRIQEKEKKVQELKQAEDTLKVSFEQRADSRQTFTELIYSIKKRCCEVRELIRDQEKAELSRAKGFLDKLEQEIADLKRRDTDLEQLSHTEDHIHFLQRFQSLCVSSGSEESPMISVNQHLTFDGVTKSLSDLKERLEKLCTEEFNKIPPQGKWNFLKSQMLFVSDFFQLTLDPNTAHHSLHLSEMNRVVTNRRGVQPYSDHPERFDHWFQVLCKDSVCGRCYWEVELSNGSYVFISVSYKGISRKGEGYDCGFGCNTWSWSLECFATLSFWHNNIETEIPELPHYRIGVYVDHSAGTLSFYRVSNRMTLLHRVHTTFTQPLYAGLWVDSGSTVRLCDPN